MSRHHEGNPSSVTLGGNLAVGSTWWGVPQVIVYVMGGVILAITFREVFLG